MLYLRPPYYIINGITVLPDHADPRQFYYLPAVPRIARRADSASNEDVPQLQLLKYRGSAGSGGFLNLDVHLGLTEEELSALRSEVERREELDAPPRLAPVPLVDGSVRMMLFGTTSGDGEPDSGGGAADESEFVIRIDQPAKPALYGQNQAAFSVRLGQAGVTAIEEALQGEMSPIGIVYSLDYLALRPAYTVQVHADWERVYEHVHRHFGVDSVFSSVEIDERVDELIEERVIQIDVDTFVPEDTASSDLIERRDRAINEVREMVTDAFFKPSIKPVDDEEEPSGWEKATSALERVVAMGATGGLSALGSFQLKKVDYERIDKKRLDVSMRERTTVRRSIHPQGHLAGLFRVLRDEGLELDRFVRSVTLDDPWFQRRTVEVISRSSFETDGIQSIQVDLAYGDETKDVLLEASDDRKIVEWASLVEEGRMVDEVSYEYTVRFHGREDGGDRPVTLASETHTETGQKAEVDTRELYGIEQVPIVALDFPWDEYPHVQVDLRYDDPENDVHRRDSVLLSEDTPETTWTLFLLDREQRDFQYRLTCRAVDHEDEVTPWTTAEANRITIRDPFPKERTLTVVVACPWEEIQNVFVDLRYRDEENDIREEQSLTFAQEDAAPKQFSADLADPDRRLVDYKATVVYRDGRIRRIPPSNTLENRIILTPSTLGHRIVRVRPEEASFTANGLGTMEVAIRYENSEADLARQESYAFDSAEAAAQFEYEFLEGEEQYEYRVKYLYSNGLSKSTDWEEEDAPNLVVPVLASQ